VANGVWNNYQITYSLPAGTNPLNYIILRNLPVAGGGQRYVFIDDVRVIEINTTPLNMTTTQVSDATPCPDQQFTISYEICLAGGATSNVSDIVVQAEVDPRFDIVSGDFSASGFYTIPTNTLTTANPCVSLVLGLSVNSNAFIGDVIPVEVRVAAGGQCSAGNTLNSVTNITITDDCEPVCQFTPSWATYFGGSGFDKITEIEIKDNGNIVILGNTDGVARNLPVTGSTTVRDIGTSQSGGFDEVFLAEISADGQSVLWINYVHSVAPEHVSAFSLDKADNNIYLAFQHFDNFYSSYSFNSTGTGLGMNSLFRFGNNGNIVWSKNYGLATESMQAIVAANDGHLYIAGSDAVPNMFVMKVDKNNANDVWKTLLSIPGFICPQSSQVAEKIVIDASGNIYVCGGEAYNNCISGSFDSRGVVYSLTSGGTQRWSRRYTGTKRFDTYTSLCTDINNTIALVGIQNADGFGPNGLIGSDIYLERLDASSGSLIFSRVIGGADSDVQYAIISDNTGNVYVSGYTASNDIIASYSALNPSVSFYHGNHTSYRPFGLDPTRSQDMLITRFSGINFIPDWFTYYGSGSTNNSDQSNDIAYNIALDNANNLIVVGETKSIDFEIQGNVVQGLASPNISTAPDGAIIKFGCGVTNNRMSAQAYEEESNFDLPENSVIIYPNPYTDEVTLNITGSEEIYSVEVYDGKGGKVFESNQLHSNTIYPIGGNLPSGIYLFRVIRDSEIKTYRLVKL
jgi:hypothetical protein